MSLTLQQIAGEFAALDQLLEEAEGEITPEIEAWLTEYSVAERDKVDAYIGYVKHLEAQAKAACGLAAELNAKAFTLEKRSALLTSRMAAHMESRGLEELRGTIWRFAFQRNGGKAPLILASEDPAAYPEDCRTTVVTLNKSRIRERLEAGDDLFEVDGDVRELPAVLGERGRSLRIR